MVVDFGYAISDYPRGSIPFGLAAKNQLWIWKPMNFKCFCAEATRKQRGPYQSGVQFACKKPF